MYFLFSGLLYYKNTAYNTTYKYVLIILPVKLPVNSRLLVVKFWENQKLSPDIWGWASVCSMVSYASQVPKSPSLTF